MTDDLFDGPGSGVKIADYEGQLLLVKPLARLTDIQTPYGTAEAISADVTVLDGKDAGETFADVRIFQKGLQGQLRTKVGTGRMVLGRLGKGVARAGQSAPWLLQEPTEDDRQLARQFLNQAAAAPF